MILYYSPGACSLVPHIALEEAGVEYAASQVTLAEGDHLKPEFLEINPHARVPALAVEGEVITENIAIINYIGHKWRAPGSVPQDDPIAAAKCNRLLSWFASSVHIAFAQVWRAERFSSDAGIHPAIQQGGHDALRRYFEEIEGQVGDGWIVSDEFSAADSYLATFFRWGCRIGTDMNAYPRWAALVAKAVERPTVQRTIEREGLLAEQFLL
jgi:glutathione S-transferase